MARKTNTVVTVETVEPMTKMEAYRWIKRMRTDVREAERQVYKGGDADDLHDLLTDIIGSANEVLEALETRGVRMGVPV